MCVSLGNSCSIYFGVNKVYLIIFELGENEKWKRFFLHRRKKRKLLSINQKYFNLSLKSWEDDMISWCAQFSRLTLNKANDIFRAFRKDLFFEKVCAESRYKFRGIISDSIHWTINSSSPLLLHYFKNKIYKCQV